MATRARSTRRNPFPAARVIFAGLCLVLVGCTASEPGPTSAVVATETLTGVQSPTGAPAQTQQPTDTSEPPAATSTAAPTPAAVESGPPASAIPATPTGAAPAASPTPTVAGAAGEVASVVNVVDGDTIDVAMGGQIYRVRYIGMNTPESNEPCESEATAANAALVSGQTVAMVKDVSETDRYGRLLRYVYAGDVFVNAELVARGYAESARYPPDTSYAGYFDSLEAQAMAANAGCWPTGVFGGAGGGEGISPTSPPASQSGYVCQDGSACIKGNINSQGERIYHFPGCASYNQTRIDESKGERWFATAAEAKAAGWRMALNCP